MGNEGKKLVKGFAQVKEKSIEGKKYLQDEKANQQIHFGTFFLPRHVFSTLASQLVQAQRQLP
jgi:hypothetical protein